MKKLVFKKFTEYFLGQALLNKFQTKPQCGCFLDYDVKQKKKKN